VNKRTWKLENEYGFTLIELLSILVILSVLFSLAYNRMVIADTNAKNVALDAGISELNGRETLTWALVKLSNSGYISDVPQVWNLIDTNIGTDYKWLQGPDPMLGGKIQFKNEIEVSLSRSPSTRQNPGFWKR
jgi:prepilin-type N-terminal cleavage/methylation domain-containing protein